MDNSPDKVLSKWFLEISDYEKAFKKWEDRNRKILKLYRDDQQSDSDNHSRFNILWSIVQTVSPAVFSRLPQPEVTRRHKDTDQLGRVAALILERVLQFELDHYPDYQDAMDNVVHDRFLGGRGTAWVRYEPVYSSSLQVTEDTSDEEEYSQVETECSPVDYVHWKDFGHSVVRTWEEVTAVWRIVYLSKAAVKKRFGKVADELPMSSMKNDDILEKESSVDQIAVYEIWDKTTKKVYWVCKGYPKILDERDDPLGLHGFFPCPKPLYSTMTSDTLVPVPDYGIYQNQAMKLDELSDRIDGLIGALKVRGVYDAAVPDLIRLLTEENENGLIPVNNWAAFSEKNGLKGAVDLVDITPFAVALSEAYKAMEQLKQQVYDLTGISDIVRGATNPNETATAQQLKGQYVSLRLKEMQKHVNRFAQSLIQIKAQIISQHYSPETIAKIADVEQMGYESPEIVMQAIQMLTTNPLMKFRITVAADSMLQVDEEQDKKDRVEFLQAAGQFMEKAGQAAVSEPLMVPLMLDMLRFAIGGFKVGRVLEGRFDQVASQIEQMAQQPKPPQPNPDMIKAQVAEKELAGTMQIEQMKLTQEAHASQERLQMESQRDTLAQQASAAIALEKMQHDERMADAQREHELLLKRLELEFERWRVEYETDAKIDVAQVAAESQEKSAMVAAEASMISDLKEDSDES